ACTVHRSVSRVARLDRLRGRCHRRFASHRRHARPTSNAQSYDAFWVQACSRGALRAHHLDAVVIHGAGSERSRAIVDAGEFVILRVISRTVERTYRYQGVTMWFALVPVEPP